MTIRGVPWWNRVPLEVVGTPSLEVFKQWPVSPWKNVFPSLKTDYSFIWFVGSLSPCIGLDVWTYVSRIDSIPLSQVHRVPLFPLCGVSMRNCILYVIKLVLTVFSICADFMALKL